MAPFQILNEADSFNAEQSEIDSVDIDILISAYAGTSVISGCAVTAQGTPDMTVAVAAGTIVVNDGSPARGTVSGGNVTITAADGSNPRIDLIVSNASGTLSSTDGTAAAEPVYPAIPANSVVLAAIFVPASDTDIDSNQITDKRVITATPVAMMADGTDGELITWDSSGIPTTIAVGAAGTILRGGGAGAEPAWSTATYPATTTVSQILYSSSNDVIAGLATGNDGVLITSGTGVPSISSTIPTATQDNITRLGTIAVDLQLDADLDFVGAQSITTTAGDLTINPTASLNVTLTPADADAFDASDGTSSYYLINTVIATSGTVAHTFDNTNVEFANIATANFTQAQLTGYTFNVTTDADNITASFATQLNVQQTTLSSDTASTNYTSIISSARVQSPSAGTNVILDTMAAIHVIDGGGGAGTETVQSGIAIDDLSAATTNYAITIGSSDADQNLIHVGVTGDPIMAWDESESAFTFNLRVHPSSNDGAALGSTTFNWSDLFLASAAVINFNNGDVTVTHSLNTLTITGGVTVLDTASTIGNLTLADGSITDSGGAITFGDENLSTTGTLASGALTVTGALAVDGDLNFTGAQAITTTAGDLTLNPTASLNVTLTAADADALTFNDGTTDYYNINTLITTDDVVAHAFAGTTVTVTSDATTSAHLMSLAARTYNWDGGVNITTPVDGLGLRILAPIVASNSAVVITQLGTLYVAAPDVSDAEVTATTLLSAEFDGNVMITSGTLYILEQAEANADLAAHGQIWVNTAVPNELYFTNDAGTDVQLGGGLANIVEDTTPQLGGTLDIQANIIAGNGGTTGIAISSAGEVNMALQPCILFYNSASDLNVTGNNTTHTQTFDTEVTDQNADFNNSTYTFTAPVAGNYLVNTCFRATGNTGASIVADLRIVADNRTFAMQFDPADNDESGNGYSAVIDMDASDTFTVTIRFHGEASDVIDISGSAQLDTFLSVALVS